MIVADTLINVFATLVLLCGLARGWFIAKGNLLIVYWLMIIMAVCNAVTNIVIVVENPNYWGIWSYNILIVWSIAMGIKGLIRLRKEGQETSH